MIWSIPVLKDATIYENDPYRNTGLDPILELRKIGDSTTNNLKESRALIKFDLEGLNTILTQNSITINDITASLYLYPVQEYNLPSDYTIEARPLALDWSNGSGYLEYPTTAPTKATATDGATWITTAGSGSTTWTGSLISGTDYLLNTGLGGGGIWYTSSVASQTFNFREDSLVTMNVTSIVNDWYNGVYNNNGFILAYNHNAITASQYPETKIQFYSSETTTVYEPQLYISWTTGSANYVVGVLDAITFGENPIVYVRNFKAEFQKDIKARILLGCRPKYPRPAFTQNSVFADMKTLPMDSYYQIKDAHTNQIIIPFSEFTKISSDSEGPYFDFYTTMMYPERFYKFEIFSKFTGITEYFTSNDFIFKIVK